MFVAPYLKYVLASGNFSTHMYHIPTANQLVALSGSFSTRSCAKRKSLELRCFMWYMQATGFPNHHRRLAQRESEDDGVEAEHEGVFCCVN